MSAFVEFVDQNGNRTIVSPPLSNLDPTLLVGTRHIPAKISEEQAEIVRDAISRWLLDLSEARAKRRRARVTDEMVNRAADVYMATPGNVEVSIRAAIEAALDEELA